MLNALVMMTALAIFIPSLLVFFKNFLEAKYIYAGASLNYEIVPKRLRGTIMPILGASSAPRDKIVITCRVPDDAPAPLIRDTLIQKFGRNCTFFD